jgi:parvulin-like peptidyl-prolyl isomerase
MKKCLIKNILCLFFLASLVGCSGKNGTGEHGKPVIRVDDHVLTLSEFNAFFEPLKMSYGTEENGEDHGLREARARFLLELIEEMIILRRAEELNLQISPGELQEALDAIEGDYDEEGLQKMFMKQAISLEAWKERARRQLLVEKVLNRDLNVHITVTPDEIRQYYDEHREEWRRGEQVRVRQILLSSKKQAQEVLKKVRKGEDFAELAEQYSTAPESSQGGDLGYVQRGNLPASLEKPIFSLTEGKVSSVIKTPYGYHIFKVIEKRKAGKQTMDDWIEEIKERIKKQKLETAYGPWLTELRSRYKITVNKEII